MLNRIVFAAGGTGGHIYPAIAIADELRKLNEKTEILFIGAKGRIEEKIVPASGYNLKTVEVKGFYRSINPKNINVVLKFLEAVRTSKKYLEIFKPEIVFGTGGFVSGPVIWSAVKLGLPSVIQEGNSYPGITVKWLSPKVDRVILNFEETKKYLKRKDNIVMMSYPVRDNLTRFSKADACKFFGLAPDKKTLFVFGGSQGAKSINNVMLKSLDLFEKNNIQVIWQTGESIDESSISKAKIYKGIKILKYIDKIDYAYSAADLIVCRSGVSTMMEVAEFGSAVIFVPFELASENHQERNARTLVNEGAARILLDRELGEKFTDTVLKTINDNVLLEQMRKNIKQFADKNAAKEIAKYITELAHSRIN